MTEWKKSIVSQKIHADPRRIYHTQDNKTSEANHKLAACYVDTKGKQHKNWTTPLEVIVENSDPTRASLS